MLEADPIANVPGFIFPVRPVLVTLLPRSLLEVSQHHNNRDSLLDDHLPEVLKGNWLWSNGGNEILFNVIKLDWGGIDVIDRRLSLTVLIKRLERAWHERELKREYLIERKNEPKAFSERILERA